MEIKSCTRTPKRASQTGSTRVGQSGGGNTRFASAGGKLGRTRGDNENGSVPPCSEACVGVGPVPPFQKGVRNPGKLEPARLKELHMPP
eukprot:CAMPEP_0169183004 /NCGR_PEP_ID=MMETSP1016-20121227/399_1 /TAXON_ID=342587 /ORGANISM="Karlodinium micrum, Strain CCMP2283" /LENGTH=88 /DNA_ID=CAMNT_0009258347 /DNA_START=446 /DNA_END=712 /DNA_ORIENTATION=-